MKNIARYGARSLSDPKIRDYMGPEVDKIQAAPNMEEVIYEEIQHNVSEKIIEELMVFLEED